MNIVRVLLLLLGAIVVGCQKQNLNLKSNKIEKAQKTTENLQKLVTQKPDQSDLKKKSIESQSDKNSMLQQKKQKMYVVYRNKEILVNYPLNFTPKIIKIYNTSEVIYKGVSKINANKFYCGRKFIQSNQKLTTQIVEIENGESLVETQYGFEIIIDENDGGVSHFIRLFGTWEPHFIILIGQIVKPGNNVLNLGSHIGLEAVVMGKIIGPSGRLFIFQPYQVSNRIVNKNVILNGLQNYTTVYKMGASDHKSKSMIKIQQSNTGGSYVIRNESSQNITIKKFEIQLNTVDSILPKDISLDFALIDVQRMQVPALRGMREIIKRSPNLIIMAEWQYGLNQFSNQNETLQFLNFMVDLGYGIFTYDKQSSQKNCKVGKMKKYTDIKQLMNELFVDIFFIPLYHSFLTKK